MLKTIRLILIGAQCLFWDDQQVRSSGAVTSPSKFADPMRGSSARRIQVFISDLFNNKRHFLTATTCTTTVALYEQAVSIGTMTDTHHSVLRLHGNHSDNVIEYEPANPHPEMLVDLISPESPSQLWLNVHPVPEGALLYKVFENMSPNEGIPWWSNAVSCASNPWQEDCDAIGGWGYDEITGIGIDDQGLMTSITLSLEVAVDSWTGTLNLRYLPHRIRHLSLTGRSVTVNLGELKYTSLKELNLQFVNISDIDLLALKGTNLEELSLSYNAAFDVASTQEILEKISDLRLRNETKLNSVAIGGTDRINFDEKKRKYRYEVRGGKQQPETPLLDNDASKRSQFSLERRATGSAPFLRRLTRLKP